MADKKTIRHYLFFLAGQQFSVLGSLIVGFTITWWITVETGSLIYLSISMFLFLLPQVFITPIAGVLSDRWNRKAIIATVDSLQAFTTFILFFLFLIDIRNIWLILMINTFRSALLAFQMPALHAIIPVMIPKDKLTRINGVNFLFNGLIYMIGPTLAALLYEFIRIQHIFLIDIITFLIALGPLLLIKVPSVKTHSKETEKLSFIKDFKTGLISIKSIPGLLSMIIFAMIFNIIFRPFSTLMPYYVNVVHNGSALDLALITTSMNIGNFLGALITSLKKEWKHKIKINIVGVMIFWCGYLNVVFAPTGAFLYMCVGVFISFIFFPIINAIYYTILQTVVPPDKVGKIISIDHTISMAISPIGAIIAGPLAELIGTTNLFFICTVLGILLPLLIWFFTKIHYLEIMDIKASKKTIKIEEHPEAVKEVIT